MPRAASNRPAPSRPALLSILVIAAQPASNKKPVAVYAAYAARKAAIAAGKSSFISRSANAGQGDLGFVQDLFSSIGELNNLIIIGNLCRAIRGLISVLKGVQNNPKKFFAVLQ